MFNCRLSQRNVARLQWPLALGFCFVGLNGFTAPEKIDFSREILPILSENCFYCHGPDANHRKAKLRLDDEAEAKRDRKGERVVFEGDSAKSLLAARIQSTDPDEQMPPPDTHKNLAPEQIALLKRWIDQGANWGEHWAFTRIKRPAVPKFKTAFAASNPIDSFVFERLSKEKLKPSPEAEKATLIRRATLDLTGFSPTPLEVDSFLKDKSANAYEKVVDRLLASPAYGERMAWDWMEAARYADSNGYQGDAERTMWPWRDWVVKAFNENMPYDKFTIAQLAGDLLPNAATEDQLATAFCRNHPINGEGGRIPEESRVDYVMDMAETTATAWLGLTVGCARCHDHKFDPISQRDYYSMFAFFNQTPVDGSGGNPQTKPVLTMNSSGQKNEETQLRKKFRAAAAQVDAAKPRWQAAQPLAPEIGELLKKSASQYTRSNFLTLEKEFEKVSADDVKIVRAAKEALQTKEAFLESTPKVMVMEELETSKSRKTFVLERGIYSKTKEEVSAATPAKLPPMSPSAPRNRLGLAQWIVSRENPLTARVTVNRFWQIFFGIGLVKTAEDFGTKGELPIHPALLDWLASEFRDSGWDTKKLVRMIVTSNTYRQSSKAPEKLRERDPDNRLLARGPRFRMPSWMLRDQALAASGLLVHKIGGAPVKPYQPAGVWEEATFGGKKYKQDEGEALYRRSLYIFWRRIIGPTELFDTPSRMTCSVKPTRNNTPLHALTTLNDTTYIEAARHLAERAILSGANSEKRVETAFQLVLARKPTGSERNLLLAECRLARNQFSSDAEEAGKFLAIGDSKRNESLDAVEHAAWTATCLAILNLDETLTKE